MVLTHENRRGAFTVWEAPTMKRTIWSSLILQKVRRRPSEWLYSPDPACEKSPPGTAISTADPRRHPFRIGRLYNTALVTVERQGGWGLPLNVLNAEAAQGSTAASRRKAEVEAERPTRLRHDRDQPRPGAGCLKWAIYEGELDSQDAEFYRECPGFEMRPLSGTEPRATGGFCRRR
jgi:hypothetical protein